jgi:hypothetical protein
MVDNFLFEVCSSSLCFGVTNGDEGWKWNRDLIVEQQGITRFGGAMSRVEFLALGLYTSVTESQHATARKHSKTVVALKHSIRITRSKSWLRLYAFIICFVCYAGAFFSPCISPNENTLQYVS